MEHLNIPPGEIHKAHNWEFADATERAAEVITDDTLVNRLALQLDDGSVWRLLAVSPATWVPVAEPARANVKTYTADGNVSGHRAMRATGAGTVSYASSGNAADANSVIGISLNAALDGGDVRVQFAGELSEPSWNWSVGAPIFCGTNGVLTQTAPTSGFCLVVGVAAAPTAMVINIKQPIIL